MIPNSSPNCPYVVLNKIVLGGGPFDSVFLGWGGGWRVEELPDCARILFSLASGTDNVLGINGFISSFFYNSSVSSNFF